MTLRRLIAVVAAALLLGACRVDAVVDVDVNTDGTGTVTVTASADADLVAQAPGLADDLRFDDAIAAGWVVEGPSATAGGGLTVTLRHNFTTVEQATVLLGSLNGPDGPLHGVVVTRSVTDDSVTTGLSGTLSVDNGLDAFADPDVLAAIGGSPYADRLAAAGLGPNDVVTFTFTAALPGTSSTTASTVAPADSAQPFLTWSMPLDGSTIDLTTTSVLSRSSAWGTVAKVALGALVLWCVLAAGFIAYVAKARRRRPQRPSRA
jgi:hypothetical protein